MKNKKTLIITSIILILILTLSITYAIFTISKMSSNSKLIVGDISLKTKSKFIL